ncbi:hypothetical protein LCGC14_2458130 [marine sediment metagenome]|uniref:DUF5678 domain-containing protein n=1 Tax=marine sediment metagenome TaxID=412755 RepID=A0A0F9C1R3_9ZZZZ
MKADSEFELKLAGGKVVTFEGQTGEEAVARCRDLHCESQVIAWRPIVHGFFLYSPRVSIIIP